MNNKILLFLSSLNPRATEQEYICPEGTIITGTQTNEAPVKYLCQKYNVTEIICIVTSEAEKTAWNYFEDKFKDIKLTKIDYDEQEEFSEKPLEQILSNIELGDEILFETTGGFRNAVMYLLLINRLLFLKGVKTSEAVYSNFQSKKIEDVSHLLTMFDLVGSIQELISMGNVKSLRNYYENQENKDQNIKNILESMEDLIESITLCKTNLIEDKMNNFTESLTNAKNTQNPLLKQLLFIFETKFGNKMDILDLISWCVESGLYQQALTVFNERMPKYILTCGDFLTCDKSQLEIQKQAYEDDDVVMFSRYFLTLGSLDLIKSFRKYIKRPENKLRLAFGNFENNEFKKGMQNIYVCLNHMFTYTTFDTMWYKTLPSDKQYLEKINDFIDNAPRNKEGMINFFTCCRTEILEIIFQIEPVEKSVDANIETIERLEQYINNSAFTPVCSIEKLKKISTDFLYIKNLRNMTNHASNVSTSSDEIQEYFISKGYQDIEKIKLKDLEKAIKEAVFELRNV